MSLREEKEAYIHLSDRRLVPDGPKMSSSPKDKKNAGQIAGKTQTSSDGCQLKPESKSTIHFRPGRFVRQT